MESQTNTINQPAIWPKMLDGPMLGTGTADQTRDGHGNILLGFLTRMQIARMRSVLHSMTDAQLAKIQLKRSDINRYAEHLIRSGT